jgi:hypothetical protein
MSLVREMPVPRPAKFVFSLFLLTATSVGSCGPLSESCQTEAAAHESSSSDAANHTTQKSTDLRDSHKKFSDRLDSFLNELDQTSEFVSADVSDLDESLQTLNVDRTELGLVFFGFYRFNHRILSSWSEFNISVLQAKNIIKALRKVDAEGVLEFRRQLNSLRQEDNPIAIGIGRNENIVTAGSVAKIMIGESLREINSDIEIQLEPFETEITDFAVPAELPRLQTEHPQPTPPAPNLRPNFLRIIGIGLLVILSWIVTMFVIANYQKSRKRSLQIQKVSPLQQVFRKGSKPLAFQETSSDYSSIPLTQKQLAEIHHYILSSVTGWLDLQISNRIDQQIDQKLDKIISQLQPIEQVQTTPASKADSLEEIIEPLPIKNNLSNIDRENESSFVTPYDQLVQTYNTEPEQISDKAIKVVETEQSISYKSQGRHQTTTLETSSKGTYWIFENKNFCYLFPKANIKINEYNYPYFQTLFISYGYQAGYSNKFRVLKPARVAQTTLKDQWELKEQGVLQFETPEYTDYYRPQSFAEQNEGRCDKF